MLPNLIISSQAKVFTVDGRHTAEEANDPESEPLSINCKEQTVKYISYKPYTHIHTCKTPSFSHLTAN
jgi:hypothetical protein